MTLRRRDICTVVPRSGDTATGAGLEDCAEGEGATLEDTDATGVRTTAARTSSLRIRPPTPVP